VCSSDLALGPVDEPSLFDWRDAPARLRAAAPRATLAGLLEGRPPARLVLVGPLDMKPGGPEWLDLVARRSAEWRDAAETHPRLRRTAVLPAHGEASRGTDVQAVIYELRVP
jgi:mannosyltransferase